MESTLNCLCVGNINKLVYTAYIYITTVLNKLTYDDIYYYYVMV